MRVSHQKYGLGIVLESFLSTGGRRVSRVMFDASPHDDRVMLSSTLVESSDPIPEVARSKKVRKPRAKEQPKPEKVNDSLLVPELDDNIRLDFSSGFESAEV